MSCRLCGCYIVSAGNPAYITLHDCDCPMPTLRLESEDGKDAIEVFRGWIAHLARSIEVFLICQEWVGQRRRSWRTDVRRRSASMGSGSFALTPTTPCHI